MTKEEKRELYRPHSWCLYENGELIDVFPSHAEAKKRKHQLVVESYRDMLDLNYEIKRVD